MKHIKRMSALLVVVVGVIFAVAVVYQLYPLKYVDTIRESSEEMGVDKYLIAALIKAESNYESEALSTADAKGVMQLTDETALFCADKMGIELNEGDIYRPEVNIRLGVYYLKRMLEMFNNDPSLAVAAYNAGEGRVKEWLTNSEYSHDGITLDIIPYEETRNHVKKINDYRKIYKILYPNL